MAKQQTTATIDDDPTYAPRDGWEAPEGSAERYLPDDWHAGYPNVWLGTSIEHRGYLWRAHTLAEVPAAVHFLSCEPLIGPIPSLPLIGYDPDYPEEGSWPLFDWLIVGAESGPHRRPFDNAWALDIQRQCRQADVAFFAKQGPGLHSEAPFGVPELDAPSARAWPR